MSDSLAAGRSAFEREAWREASTRLAAADETAPLGAADLDRLATAAYLIGDDELSQQTRQRAVSAHAADGHPRLAARSACWLAFALLEKPRQRSHASGWLSRAARLVADHPDCVERGLLQYATAYGKFSQGDVEGARVDFAHAAELGHRLGDPDLEALARHGEGRMLVRLEDRAAGFALLDDVMVGVTCGEVGPITAGVVYCSVISACHETWDWRRAQEWTAALSTWCEAHPDMVPFRGACLVRRAEVLALHGDWRVALDEARRAIPLLDDAPSDRAAAYDLIGDLLRAQGSFDEAEAAYRAAQKEGSRRSAGPARLWLARNRPNEAVTAIRGAVEDTRQPRARLDVLSAAAEIGYVTGDAALADAGARELAGLAETRDAVYVRAAAATAAGLALLASERDAAPLATLRESRDLWQTLDAPYKLARSRVLAAEAYRRLDDAEGAILELEAALEAFTALGAEPDARATSRALGTALTARSTTPGVADARGSLTGREVEVLRLVATGRTNRVIASELGISEKTVARHISNIFNKLDLSSRTAAAAYAYEHGLV